MEAFEARAVVDARHDFDLIMRDAWLLFDDIHQARAALKSTKQHGRIGALYGMPKLHKKPRKDGLLSVRIVVNPASQ